MNSFKVIPSILVIASLITGCGSSSVTTTTAPLSPTRTIVMVWDGLRPDSINAVDTPNLYNLKMSGVEFADNHSIYPTFTMMNGQGFASGSYPGTAAANTSQGTGSGFYGNTFWQPSTTLTSGVDNGGAGINSGSLASFTNLYIEPVFTEDHLILDTLNTYYQSSGEVGLLLVKSLFANAQANGLKTATVGKSGAAYIQDFTQSNSTNRYFIDENSVRPASLVKELVTANYSLPADTQYDPQYAGANDPTGTAGGLHTYMTSQNIPSPTYRAGINSFSTTQYDPTGGGIAFTAKDPSDASQGAPEDASNKYMMQVYTDWILPKHLPDLSLIWFRTPDNTEHSYGPGSPNAIAGLRSQDQRLGELITALRTNGLDSTTNIIVVSDHGHSSVSGPVSTFPLRSMLAYSGTTLAAGGAAPVAPSNGATSSTGVLINANSTNVSNASYRCTNASNDLTTPATFGVQTGGVPSCNAASVTTNGNSGYSFSGDIRLADLLYYRGQAIWDGSGCATSGNSGFTGTTTLNPLQPILSNSATLCGSAATKYMAISAGTVPATIPNSGGVANPNAATPRASFVLASKSASYANNFVVTTNQGGSDFLYVPSHTPATVAQIVKSLQQRPEVGAIFVDSRYLPGGANAATPAIGGVLPMSAVNLENTVRKGDGQPDIVVSFNWAGTVVSTSSTIANGTLAYNIYGLGGSGLLPSSHAVVTANPPVVQGMNGTTFESFANNHGMHGSMGTTDVHNTLIANGPSFKSGVRVTNPSGNVDVAPTVAYLLGTSMSGAQGRILNEGLVTPQNTSTPTVVASVLTPTNFGVAATATGLTIESFTDLTGATAMSTSVGDPVTPSVGSYSINLAVKDLTVNGSTYRYFDYAQAVRQ